MNNYELEIKKLKERVEFLEESLEDILKILELHSGCFSQIAKNFNAILGK